MTDEIRAGLIWMFNTPIWLDMGALSPNANAKKFTAFPICRNLVRSMYSAAMSTVDS